MSVVQTKETLFGLEPGMIADGTFDATTAFAQFVRSDGEGGRASATSDIGIG